jgi:hypothetical protein
LSSSLLTRAAFFVTNYEGAWRTCSRIVHTVCRLDPLPESAKTKDLVEACHLKHLPDEGLEVAQLQPDSVGHQFPSEAEKHPKALGAHVRPVLEIQQEFVPVAWCGKAGKLFRSDSGRR